MSRSVLPLNRLPAVASFPQAETAMRPRTQSFMKNCTARPAINPSRRKRRKFHTFKLTCSYDAKCNTLKVPKRKCFWELLTGSPVSFGGISVQQGRGSSLYQRFSLLNGSSVMPVCPWNSCFVNMHVVFRKKGCSPPTLSP